MGVRGAVEKAGGGCGRKLKRGHDHFGLVIFIQ
jgi:hypothetical protein